MSERPSGGSNSTREGGDPETCTIRETDHVRGPEWRFGVGGELERSLRVEIESLEARYPSESPLGNDYGNRSVPRASIRSSLEYGKGGSKPTHSLIN